MLKTPTSITPKSKELQVIEAKLLPPAIPRNWNYEVSVAKTKQLIYKWKNITKEIAEELYIAREKLSQKREGKISEQ